MMTVVFIVILIMCACNKKVNYKKLDYSETEEGCYINAEEIEFQIDMSVYDCLKDPKPIREKEQACDLAVKLLEEHHEKGEILNFDLIYVKYFKENEVWLFTYTREIEPGYTDYVFRVAINGNTGEVIVAWPEE